MKFDLIDCIKVLQKTPSLIEKLLNDLSSGWIENNEGENTWSPYDILGHLIHGEITDWIPRAKIILSDQENKNFIPFDRFAQFKNSQGKTLAELLIEFKKLRSENILTLKSFDLNDEKLKLTGIHPEFGKVSLEQLLATWLVHDLSHINQMTRVMARQYRNEVGPWTEYISILK